MIDEANNQKMSVISKVFIGTLLLLVATVFAIMTDITFFNSRHYNKIVYGSDCSYEIPNGYKIAYSASKKKYAVADLKFEDYYLYNGKYGIEGMFMSIAEPSLFDDTCGAKAYLKAYIKDTEPKIKDLK